MLIAPGKYPVDNIYKVKENIEFYNSLLLDSKADSINLYPAVEEIDQFLLKDGYHLNQVGDKLIMKSVAKY